MVFESAFMPDPVFPARPRFGPPQRCRLCHRPVAAGDSGVCDAPTCQSRLRVEAAAAIAQHKQRKDDALRALSDRRTRAVRRKAAQEIGVPHQGRIAHGVAPYIDILQQPLPAKRRAAFEAHLRSIIAESFAKADGTDAQPEPPETDPGYAKRLAEEAPEPTVLNAACIVCQGDCCLLGGTRHGFLTEETISCQRWKDPGLTPEALAETYLSYLPETSTTGSCVYHGPQGCTLPRPLRADICNSFQCSARRQLAEAVARRPGTGAVVAGLSRDHVTDPSAGAAFLRVVSVTAAGDVTVHDHLSLPALRKGLPED